jgi:hypothetical protein
MRILFINSIQMFGGGEVWMLRALREFQARGHQVWLCCRPCAEVGKRAMEQGIPVKTLSFFGDFDPVTIARLTWFMKRERIDVVLTNMDKELRLGGIAAKIAGVPAVIPRRGIDYPLKNRWRYRFAYNVLATRIIANSAATKQALLRHAPWLDSERIEVIYNGIDMKPFLQSKTRNLRSRWGVLKDAPCSDLSANLISAKASTFCWRLLLVFAGKCRRPNSSWLAAALARNDRKRDSQE